MPYQPTNPYPYNTAIDLQDGLQFRFKVDSYDTIEHFKIELYDYLKNKKIYTIGRFLGEIQFNSKFQIHQDTYVLQVNESQQTVTLYENDEVICSTMDMEDFKIVIESYADVLKEKILMELDRMPTAMSDKSIVSGNLQIIQILNENEEQILLQEDTENTPLPIKGGLGEKSIGEVDVSPYLATIEALEKKQYYNNTENYEQLNITNSDCFIVDNNGTIIKYEEEENKGDTRNIVIPYRASNGTIIKNIHTGVFQSNQNIQTVVIPSCINTIGVNAFQGCANLQEVILNYGVSQIKEGCFLNCTNLSRINLLDSIEIIEKNAFQDCQNLKELRLPWSLKCIKQNAFNNIGVEKLELPVNLEEIEAKGFFGCKFLETVQCNDLLKNIGEQAFGECGALKKVSFNNDLMNLGEKVFMDCESIQEIVIPQHVQTIGSAIFKGCIALSKLTVPFIGSQIQDSNVHDDTMVLGYFFGKEDVSEVVKEGITITEQYYDISTLTYQPITAKYLIPNSLRTVIITEPATFIPLGAFSNCSNIREVVMSDTIIEIQDFGFYDCFKISTIKLSPNTKYIGAYAFALKQQKTLG